MKKVFLAAAIAGLTVVGCTVGEPQNSAETSIVEQKESENQSVTFADGLIELQFPSGWYENKTSLSSG